MRTWVLIAVWVGCVAVGAIVGFLVGYILWQMGFELLGSAAALVGAGVGGIVVFLFWLYVVGLIVVTGVELNSFIEHPTRSVHLSAISARGLAGQHELPLLETDEQRSA